MNIKNDQTNEKSKKFDMSPCRDLNGGLPVPQSNVLATQSWNPTINSITLSDL